MYRLVTGGRENGPAVAPRRPPEVTEVTDARRHRPHATFTDPRAVAVARRVVRIVPPIATSRRFNRRRHAYENIKHFFLFIFYTRTIHSIRGQIEKKKTNLPPPYPHARAGPSPQF